MEVREDWSICLRGPVAEACEGALAPELAKAGSRWGIGPEDLREHAPA